MSILNCPWFAIMMLAIFLGSCDCDVRNQNNGTSLSESPSPFLVQNGANQLEDLWRKIEVLGRDENTFVGRCFGVARKLKFVLPLIIFKLGVIVTTLVFLTIFSMKSLGIGLLLVLMNAVKIVAKWAAFKHDDHQHGGKVVNYHIYKNSHHSASEDAYLEDFGPSGWNDKSGNSLLSSLTPSQRLRLLNLYSNNNIYGSSI